MIVHVQNRRGEVLWKGELGALPRRSDSIVIEGERFDVLGVDWRLQERGLPFPPVVIVMRPSLFEDESQSRDSRKEAT